LCEAEALRKIITSGAARRRAPWGRRAAPVLLVAADWCLVSWRLSLQVPRRRAGSGPESAYSRVAFPEGIAVPTVPTSTQPDTLAARAQLLLVALSLAWGITWPTMKIALWDIPPFSMRVGSLSIGALTLFAFGLLRRRDLRIPAGVARLHVLVAGVLNVALFSLLVAFAQLDATTSRVTILSYTMPIWAAAMARPVLGERLNVTRGVALALCVAGIAVLVYPLIGTGVPPGILIALGAAVTWAAGTVYLKWARIEADPLAVAAWQVLIAFIVISAGLPIFEGALHVAQAGWPSILALIFSGLVGSGIAYLIWFEIVRRLPATTASLGALSVPVVGVAASAAMLGERPTVPDLVGFALIMAAAACVILQPASRVHNPARRDRN
jgi:drug/metabolite transporter (DMT)-like permease